MKLSFWTSVRHDKLHGLFVIKCGSLSCNSGGVRAEKACASASETDSMATQQLAALDPQGQVCNSVQWQPVQCMLPVSSMGLPLP